MQKPYNCFNCGRAVSPDECSSIQTAVDIVETICDVCDTRRVACVGGTALPSGAMADLDFVNAMIGNERVYREAA